MANVLSPPQEQKIILENVSWETYERLLAEHNESAGPRFTYDNGYLELMILSVEHEEPNRTLALIVDIVAAELRVNVRRIGSNTCKREDLLKGFEPDSAFYVQNAASVRGKKRIDLRQDPPPDLVIEIDVTSPSVPRFPIFAAVGVPEVWRCRENVVQIFKLQDGSYEESEQSLALPPLTGDVLTRFLEENETLDSPDWMQRVRAWAQERKT